MGTKGRGLGVVAAIGASVAALVVGAAGPVWAVPAASTIAVARLENTDYQQGLLTPQEAKAFLGTTTVTPNVNPYGTGDWRPTVCGKPVAASTVGIAGRSVQYSPELGTSLVNFATGFPAAAAAKDLTASARRIAASCDEPYAAAGGTFTPSEPPALPKVGDSRFSFGGVFSFSDGTSVNSAQIGLQKGQVVDYVQMLSIADITPQIVKSVAVALDKRLDRLASAAAKSKRRTPGRASRVKTCDKLIAKAQLESAFNVELSDADDCRYSLAEGFGGVDVSMTTAKDGGVDTFTRLADGEPVTIKGVDDAFFKTSENQFGQVSESLYVLLPNGDSFSISLRGDDAPKDQKVQLVQAGKAAVKNAV